MGDEIKRRELTPCKVCGGPLGEAAQEGRPRELQYVRIGSIVNLVGAHPWAGSSGVVVRRESWFGRASLVVRLLRDDAFDGHEAGVRSVAHVRVVGQAP